MFYTEEDIKPVADLISSELGVNGNMDAGNGVLKNVYVQCAEFGKVWYGDYAGTTKQLDILISKMSTASGYNLFYTLNQ
jgi:hypothetical protein